jgi:TonB family protein
MHAQSSPVVGRVSEEGIRRFATITVLPTFPDDALRAKESGVAVASIEVDVNGRISRLEVVEAPSPSIKASVTQAVQKWQFDPTYTGGRPTRLLGKLTFYFVIRGGKGLVLNPSEAGYVGPSPKKRAQTREH